MKSKMDILLDSVSEEHLKKSIPDFRPGDTLSVSVKVKEGDKERHQRFEGMVISKRGSGANQTVMLRKISQGVGVERIFLLHSPNIDKVKVVKKGSVRRAKLFYLRKTAAGKSPGAL